MATRSASFRRITSLVAIFGLIAGLMVLEQATPASASNTNDPMQMQSEIDTTPQECTSTTQWACGGWDQLDPDGVVSRPFVKRFSVVTGGVETLIVDNSSNSINPSYGSSNLRVVISPTNLCGPDQPTTRPDGSPLCYSTPNRVAVTVGYQGQDGGHYDLRTPGATTPAVDETTEYRITLALNTIGQNLRWTYLNGTPTYWKVTQLGLPTATLSVRFRAGEVPFVGGGGGCSQIPVNPTCAATNADEMLLSASMVLSLDNTLDAMFTGALFAGSRAFIGSLETVRTTGAANSPAPQLTYGIAAPKTVGATTNAPTFSAFLSEEVILNYFGIPLDTFLPDGSLPGVTGSFFDQAFAFTNAGGTRSVSRWTAAGQGTEGMFLKLANIPLSTTTVSDRSASRLGTSALAVTNPKYKVASKTAPTITASRTKVVVTGKIPACSLGSSCRIRVVKLGSKYVKTTTNLMNAPKPIVLNTTPVTSNYDTAMTSGGRVAVIIESKAANSTVWKYATSVVRSVG